MKIPSLKVKCEKCKNEFEISANVSHDLKSLNVSCETKFFTINGQSIKVIYCYCPRCGSCHILQIDDSHTLDMLLKIRDNYKRVKSLNNGLISNKILLNDLYEDVRVLQKNLNNRRNKLMNQLHDIILNEIVF